MKKETIPQHFWSELGYLFGKQQQERSELFIKQQAEVTQLIETWHVTEFELPLVRND